MNVAQKVSYFFPIIFWSEIFRQSDWFDTGKRYAGDAGIEIKSTVYIVY